MIDTCGRCRVACSLRFSSSKHMSVCPSIPMLPEPRKTCSSSGKGHSSLRHAEAKITILFFFEILSLKVRGSQLFAPHQPGTLTLRLQEVLGFHKSSRGERNEKVLSCTISNKESSWRMEVKVMKKKNVSRNLSVFVSAVVVR